VRLGAGQLVVHDLGRIGLQGLTLLLAVGVDVGVRQNPVEPSLEVGAGLVLVEGRERLGEGLLDEILGVGRVARRAQCSAVELVQEGHCLDLEAHGPLCERLGAQVKDRLVLVRGEDGDIAGGGIAVTSVRSAHRRILVSWHHEPA